MRFIITPSQSIDIQECLDAGMHDFFIDLEVVQAPIGSITNSPNQLEDCERIRGYSENIKIFLRPDGEELRRSKDYLQEIIAAKANYIFYPNAEDVDEIKSLSYIIENSGAKFIAMIETTHGFNALSDILAIDTVSGVYMGLHDFSKSLGCRYVFEPILQGYLDQLAAGAKHADKPFGFTSVSPSLTGEMILSLAKEHARLGSGMTLASVMRLRDMNKSSLQQILSELSRLYQDARLMTSDIQEQEHKNLLTLLNNAQKSAA